MLKGLANHLRKRQTNTEKYLWKYLRDRQLAKFKFRRQHKIGPYVADFVCLKQQLVIELDGEQHVNQTEYDAKRTAYLESQGFRVLRFWNNEVFSGTEAVMLKILQVLELPPYLVS